MANNSVKNSLLSLTGILCISLYLISGCSNKINTNETLQGTKYEDEELWVEDNQSSKLKTGYIEETSEKIVDQYASILKKLNNELKHKIEQVYKKSEPAVFTPRNIFLLYYRGIGYKTKEEYDKAKADYEHMIEGPPQTATPTSEEYFNQGLDLADKQMHSEAIRCYTKGLALNPNDSLMLNARASALINLSQLEQALQDCNKAIQLQPCSTYYFNRALIYQREEKYQEAIADAKQAITLDPKFSEAYGTCGYCYEKMEDFSRANEQYDKCLELKPKSDDLYLRKGRCLRYLGKDKEAVASLENGLKINPKNELLYWESAKLFEKAEELQPAIDAYRLYIEYAPKEQAVYIDQARDRIKDMQAKNK